MQTTFSTLRDTFNATDSMLAACRSLCRQVGPTATKTVAVRVTMAHQEKVP